HTPMKSATSELALCLVADMDREGRRGSVEELVYMVVGEDDPKIGAERPQSGADLCRRRLDALDRVGILGFGHREKFTGHGAASLRRSRLRSSLFLPIDRLSEALHPWCR